MPEQQYTHMRHHIIKMALGLFIPRNKRCTWTCSHETIHSYRHCYTQVNNCSMMFRTNLMINVLKHSLLKYMYCNFWK